MCGIKPLERFAARVGPREALNLVVNLFNGRKGKAFEVIALFIAINDD